jgi:hypothetical protein
MSGALPASEALWRRTLDLSERVFGRRHPLTAVTQEGLSWVLLWLGKIPEGRMLADSAMATSLARLHPDLPKVQVLHTLQMSYALVRSDTVVAVAEQDAARALLPATGAQRPLLEVSLDLSSAMLEMQRRDTVAAWRTMARAATMARDRIGPTHFATQVAIGRLADFSKQVGRDPATGASAAR